MEVIGEKHNEVMNKFDKFISMYQKVDEEQQETNYLFPTNTIAGTAPTMGSPYLPGHP